MDDLPENAVKAHDFELSYRAHPSVSTDPFYSSPPDSLNAAPGTLLKVEAVTDTSKYTLAPGLSLSRFMYQSQTFQGRRVPVSAYILWPYSAREYENEGGKMPMVVWAHGTSGNNDESAPSNIQHLWHHFQAPYQLALQGYVVVATDYAGLGVGKDAAGEPVRFEYLNGISQANDLAYSIPAAQKAFPELSKNFVMVGSSLGGLAAWAFAERQVSKTVDGHLGTVIFHPGTNILNLKDEALSVFLPMMIPGLENYQPDFKPDDLLTGYGCQMFSTFSAMKGCNTLLFQFDSKRTLRDDFRSNVILAEYVKLTAAGGKKVHGDVLFIHGEDDPIVSVESVTEAKDQLVSLNPDISIEFHVLPNVTHASALYAGFRRSLDWIDARFLRKPLEAGHASTRARLARPPEAQQVEANWHMEKQSGPWQAF